jgi:hypothetical protein
MPTFLLGRAHLLAQAQAPRALAKMEWVEPAEVAAEVLLALAVRAEMAMRTALLFDSVGPAGWRQHSLH